MCTRIRSCIITPQIKYTFFEREYFFSVDKLEKEANTFAMQLLISDDDLKEYQDCTIEQISNIFGFHENLIHLRISKFNYVQDVQDDFNFFIY